MPDLSGIIGIRAASTNRALLPLTAKEFHVSLRIVMMVSVCSSILGLFLFHFKWSKLNTIEEADLTYRFKQQSPSLSSSSSPPSFNFTKHVEASHSWREFFFSGQTCGAQEVVIDHQARVVYVENHKAGSSSMRSYLGLYRNADFFDYYCNQINCVVLPKFPMGYCGRAIAASCLLPQNTTDYIWFSVVREPVAKFESRVHEIKSIPMWENIARTLS